MDDEIVFYYNDPIYSEIKWDHWMKILLQKGL